MSLGVRPLLFMLLCSGHLMFASDIARESTPRRSAHRSSKKEAAPPPERADVPLLGTLVQTHTDERVPLSEVEPSQARFATLLRDRVTGQRHAMAPELLGLLQRLAATHPGARIELVSGYRNPKLNESMRKKGHHVASHSQHSLGHAVDFRIIEPGATRAIAPDALEKEIRALGWVGGVGTYPKATDWFVHADVGKNRRWRN